MKALSVRQPWAHAIIHLGKTVENRPRRTHYRGPLAIHASKTVRPFPLGWPSSFRPPAADELVYGAVIGVVDLIDCRPVEELSLGGFPASPWAFGPWCWIVANPRPIVPWPCLGQLSLFNVPDSILRRRRRGRQNAR